VLIKIILLNSIMTGAELIAILSVAITGFTTILTTCFHSRCSEIDCWGVKCKRQVMNEIEARPVV
tara:strand:+ start:2771 stop:2965 length:195 start_codon:yes stop_codon:yes gene_type:complete